MQGKGKETKGGRRRGRKMRIEEKREEKSKGKLHDSKGQVIKESI